MKPGTRNLLIGLAAVTLLATSFGVTWAIARGDDDAEAIERLEYARSLCAAVGADASGLAAEALFGKSDEGRVLSAETSGAVSIETAQALLSCAAGRIGGPEELRQRIRVEPTGEAEFGAYAVTWKLTGGRFQGSIAID